MFTFIEYPVKLNSNFTEDAPVLIHIKLCTLSLRNVSKFMIKTCHMMFFRSCLNASRNTGLRKLREELI